MTWGFLRKFFGENRRLPFGVEEQEQKQPPDFSELIAYQVLPSKGLQLDTAPRDRAWIDATHEQFAYRCLPMLIANQSGWVIRNSHRILVEWNGGAEPSDLTVNILDGPAESHIVSLFGYGIITWRMPFLFRTPPGMYILARGPANMPKHGAYPLEGVVETDWAVATFTMNWKITRPGEQVLFDIGEPVCMVVPQRRGDLEAFRPTVRPIESDPELKASYMKWRNSRQAFVRARANEVGARRFQKHYLRGTTVEGTTAEVHQVKVSLRPFVGQNRN